MHPMRRKERAVTDPCEIRKIAESCKVCRLGLYDGKEVYIVPMNVGTHWDGEKPVLYFHCGKEGRKLDILAQNPCAAVEMDCEYGLIEAEKACGYGFHYASLMGTASVSVVSSEEEKITGLKALMWQQTGKEFEITPAMAAGVAVLKAELKEYSCKRH